MGPERHTDEDLLLARDPRDAGPAFGLLYARQEALIVAFHQRRVRNPKVAVDLAAETFAEYLNRQSRERRGNAGRRPMVLPRQDESNWESNVVQVVPDGVAAVRYRAAGKVMLKPVRDNVVIVRVKPATRSGGVGLAWLDAQGRELQKGSRFPAVKPRR